ncbi:putative exoribonuclease [Heterostelium album PN500]|uniref:Ribosomal RNA-processing protein 44 n=1 Tax=Heterostelium pallidum (strain ATCC 26659 / Pp 5 / PN500) TaxID=670386 RepID=D3B6I9_HETP5|nr:putative exoribonuclease [Heterostelium album PN500]EFA82959.1 putative exoribonuclease [Heterostelium album PN500]|eukprot:XP_020435076.1 putative exoribonuclease [Heterostelium album PN500]
MSHSNKEYYRATRRGKIIKVVREVYLRDDLICGHQKCQSCLEIKKRLYRTVEERERAESTYSELTGEGDSQKILILDTNVVLHQIDLLEDPTIKNVVILTTVLDEVKSQNFPIYNRLREIIKNQQRQFYVYSNEHSKYTAITRDNGETSNDRNDRAIRVATEWYRAHLKKLNVNVLLVTNDRDNLAKAKALGLDGKTIQDLVMEMSDVNPSLVDKLSSPDDDDHSNSVDAKKFQFAEHRPMSLLTEQLKQGQIYQGIIRTDRSNYLEALVKTDSPLMEQEILIQGLESMNRAVDGDIVAVELLPKAEWSRPSGVVLLDTEAIEDDDDSIAKDASSVSTAVGDGQPTGRVVGIIKRNWKPYCGAVEFKGDINSVVTNQQQQLLFVAIDRRIPKIRIRSRQVSSVVGRRIVVAIDSWERHSRYPSGHFVKDLGPLGDRETESQVLLLQFDIPHHPFGASVMKCLPPPDIMDHVSPADMLGRRDLRGECIFSVDPPGCTDIDDALHCKRLPDGNFEVGVHIADVSHFVREGAAIDEEASHRGTTVYLVDRRIDMLPGELSSNLCSLMSNVDRFSFSVIWKMDPNGNVLDVEYTKSLIRSVASMTYEQAQIKIDDASQNDIVATNLRLMLALSKKLKSKRFDAGALILASPQVKFKTEEVGGDPSDVELYQMRETNSMIEEFMLLANIWVAKKIHKHFPGCALLRRHPTPKASSFELLSKLVEQKGFDFRTDTSKLLAESLDLCVIPDDPYFNTLLRIMTTRCMFPAQYFSSGSVPYEEYFHYGLASEIYTHFTSPIRRYPDVIVHRLLASAIGVTSVSLKMDNKTGRKTTENAYIIRVKANAFVVLVPRYGFEGTVYVSEPNQPTNFIYDCTKQTLSNGSLTFRVFDMVTVEIFVDDSKAHDQKLMINCINPVLPNIKPKYDVVEKTTATKTPKDEKKKNTTNSKDLNNRNLKKQKL